MQTKKLTEELKLTRSFQDLIQVYEEAAITKIQQIRDGVIRSRNFMQELLLLVAEVKNSYKNSQFKDDEKKSKKKVEVLNTRLEILLSPMEKMTGDIAYRVVMQFIQDTKSTNADAIVLGRIGRDILEQYGYSKKYLYFDVPNPQHPGVKDLLTKIISYDQVKIYHGHYVNLLTQQPKISNLSGEAALETQKEVATGAHIEYLFEPSIEELQKIFEQQILGTLFNQTLSEADLARLGSRITAMESANTNVEGRLKLLKRQQLLMQKSIENHKQMERMAGIFFVEGRV